MILEIFIQICRNFTIILKFEWGPRPPLSPSWVRPCATPLPGRNGDHRFDQANKPSARNASAVHGRRHACMGSTAVCQSPECMKVTDTNPLTCQPCSAPMFNHWRVGPRSVSPTCQQLKVRVGHIRRSPSESNTGISLWLTLRAQMWKCGC
jgi:hypothetical protein